jgi:hypothetical protein
MGSDKTGFIPKFHKVRENSRTRFLGKVNEINGLGDKFLKFRWNGGFE